MIGMAESGFATQPVGTLWLSFLAVAALAAIAPAAVPLARRGARRRRG
jgi:hypothetical protein